MRLAAFVVALGVTGTTTAQVASFDAVSIRINPGAAGAVSDLPSFFTALQEQLGLKLDAQDAEVDVLVIASVERPSGN